MRPIFDTNIIIDYFRKIPAAYQEISFYPEASISIITWIEVMSGSSDKREEEILKKFLGKFTIVHINKEIAELSAQIRRNTRLKLPDAIIWATAKHKDTMLVTRNTNDFPLNEPDIRVPYTI